METANPLRVLIACEFSGTVRRAFDALGHDVWSCDLLPAEDGSNRHIRGDVRDVLNDGWDLLIVAHPPCTRLCNSGVRWLTTPPPGRTLPEMWAELDAGADLFSAMWNAPVERVAVENPVMHRHAKERIAGYDILGRARHDGDTFLSNAKFYATRDEAEADYARLYDRPRARLAVRPATAREQVVGRFTARAVAYQSARDWNAAGEMLLARIGKRVRARAVAA